MNLNIKDNYKKIFFFIIITLIFKPTWLFNNQDLGKPGNDDLSHWLHSATLVYDFDINYVDDYEVEKGVFNELTNTPFHPPGAGYLSSPFVFIFSLLDHEEPSRLNPVGSYAYLGFFMSSVFYFLFGSILLINVLDHKRIFSNLPLLFLSLLVGTIAHFVATRFMMSHSIEFFLCSYLIYLFETKDNYLERKSLFLIFITYFLLSITRPSTFIYSLCLIVVYLKKSDYSMRNFLKLSLLITSTLVFHTFTSLKLYNTLSILQNYQSNWKNHGWVDFNLSSILLGTTKVPYLFFSFSMGVVWSIPIIFYGLVSLYLGKKFLKNKNWISKLFLFMYIYGAIVVLIVWQGREVSFGQRLLIGLIPFFLIRTAESIENNKYKTVFKINTFITYLGYIYFYSSEKLNLNRGETLWGTTVNFAGEDYYLNLFREFYLFENFISVMGRTIYSVNIFSFLKIEKIIENFKISSLFSDGKLDQVLKLGELYINLNKTYLLVANLIIFIFCYLFTNLVFKKQT